MTDAHKLCGSFTMRPRYNLTRTKLQKRAKILARDYDAPHFTTQAILRVSSPQSFLLAFHSLALGRVVGQSLPMYVVSFLGREIRCGIRTSSFDTYKGKGYYYITTVIERMYDAGLPQGRRQIARLTLADNEVTVENSKYMPVPATCVWTGGRVLEGNEVAIARMSEPCVQIWTWQHKRAEEVAAPHKICVWNLVVHSSPVTEHMSLKVGALPI